MQVTTNFVGYKSRPYAWNQAANVLLSRPAGCLTWLLGGAVLKSLPYTAQLCSLSEAEFVVTKLENGRHQLGQVRHIVGSASQTATLKNSRFCRSGSIRSLVLLQATYVYDWSLYSFIQLPKMPDDLPPQAFLAKKALLLIGKGADWSTLNPHSAWSRYERSCLYHTGTTIAQPRFFTVLMAFWIQPFQLVQYVEAIFHIYEQYYWYAGLLLFISFAAGTGAAVMIHQRQLQLYKSVVQHHLVPIVQAGHVRMVSSKRLVPGDVIMLLRGKATCDMVLLQGSCLVEESVLSGEASQLRKTSLVVPDESEGARAVAYDPDTQHYCTIYAGTNIQQVWTQDADDEVLAMVVRTGVCTVIGSMLRQVFAPYKEFQVGVQLVEDIYRFCSFAVILQLAVFALYALGATRYAQSPGMVIQRLLALLVAAAPATMPTVLIFASCRCGFILQLQKIWIPQAAKIFTAAAVEVVVFDKTGTLTGNAPKLHGMLPVVDGEFTDLQQDAVRWPTRLKQCAAVCNSLNLVRKGALIGDTADYAAFKTCEATFQGRDTISLPVICASQRCAKPVILTILKRFEFEPQLPRSGVIVTDSAGPQDEMLFFVRGAHITIQQLIGRGPIPSNFQEVIDEYSRQSFRLLSLAVGVLKGLDKQALSSMTQEQLEKHCLSFDYLGLLVLSNGLRLDSRATVLALQQQAGLRTLMATGDYHHTALAAARGVGMVPPQGQVVIIQAKSEMRRELARRPSAIKRDEHDALSHAAGHAMRSVAFADPLAASSNSEHQGLVFHVENGNAQQDDASQALAAIAQGEAQCCITGSAFQHMLQLGDESLLETVMRNVVVLSRMKSHQKAQVMDLLGSKCLQHAADDKQHSIAFVKQNPMLPPVAHHKQPSNLFRYCLSKQLLPRVPLPGSRGSNVGVQGLGNVCMYCGDGANDLMALTHADVGVSVGTGDAAAGAPMSIDKPSVAGLVPLLRETRAAVGITLAAVQFMVLYQLVLSLMYGMAFVMEGGTCSLSQRSLLDVVAVGLGAACSLQPARGELHARRGPQALCRRKHLIMLTAATLLAAATTGTMCWYLTIQPWYAGSNHADKQAAVITWTWTVALVQAVGLPYLVFRLNTQDLCKIRTPLVTALVTLFVTEAFLCGLMGAAQLDKYNVYQFYKFPWAFRWRTFLYIEGAIMACTAVLTGLHGLLSRHEQVKQRCQVLPSLAAAAHS